MTVLRYKHLHLVYGTETCCMYPHVTKWGGGGFAHGWATDVGVKRRRVVSSTFVPLAAYNVCVRVITILLTL